MKANISTMKEIFEISDLIKYKLGIHLFVYKKSNYIYIYFKKFILLVNNSNIDFLINIILYLIIKFDN